MVDLSHGTLHHSSKDWEFKVGFIDFRASIHLSFKQTELGTRLPYLGFFPFFLEHYVSCFCYLLVKEERM